MPERGLLVLSLSKDARAQLRRLDIQQPWQRRNHMVDVTSYKREKPGNHPPHLYPGYGSTVKRAPKRRPIRLEQTLSEVTGPTFAGGWVGPAIADLTKAGTGAPLGERIILAGRVLDEDGRPAPGTLVELWQANSSGRYLHDLDQHNAPLDPNFTGKGHVITDAAGDYRFLTIKPGAYPWRNTHNAWRPQHLHFSIFGPAFATRLVTQMYFPGDPLLPLDPIFNSTPDPEARDRLICAYDPDLSEAEYALGYRFDIVLRGRVATPMET
jgi:protocatechuate 3,4-dioxygenase beta subunit